MGIVGNLDIVEGGMEETGINEPWSRLLVSPLVTPITLPIISPK